MPAFLLGQSPNSHCVMSKKLRTDQAKLKVTTNKLARFASTLGTKKRTIEQTDKSILIAPGRPKLVCGELIPVTVVWIAAM